MPSSLNIILTELPKLRPSEIFYVSKAVEEQAMSIATVTTVSDEIKEKRFNKGVICPHCNTNHTVRNGKVNGKQRYLCKGCGKSFGDFTNFVMSGTKRTHDKWFSYMKCMIKKIGLLLLIISFCLLSACDNQMKVSGKVIEVSIDEETGVVSFVVQTDGNKDIEIFITNETTIFSFVDGITADEFKEGAFSDVIVSVKHDNSLQSSISRNNQEIISYNAKEVQITGFLTDQIVTLSDGTMINIWNDVYGSSIYTLQDGTELLQVHNMSGPNDVYVDGIESFGDLGKEAQSNILKFYENQGLLYDIQIELEKAYDEYLKKEDSLGFDGYLISQDIMPRASNEYMMYFLTSVQLPINNDEYYEYRIGAAFDRKTGKAISNWDLFSCSPEEARQKILDISGVNDPVLRKEMEIAFKPENIILLPNNMEICFQQGTLTSYPNMYKLVLDYDHTLSEILNEWVIPKNKVN